jgi:hypothetical protein
MGVFFVIKTPKTPVVPMVYRLKSGAKLEVLTKRLLLKLDETLCRIVTSDSWKGAIGNAI